MDKILIWYKVLDEKNDLPEGRIKTVTAGSEFFHHLIHHPGEIQTYLMTHPI